MEMLLRSSGVLATLGIRNMKYMNVGIREGLTARGGAQCIHIAPGKQEEVLVIFLSDAAVAAGDSRQDGFHLVFVPRTSTVLVPGQSWYDAADQSTSNGAACLSAYLCAEPLPHLHTAMCHQHCAISVHAHSS